MQTYSLKCYKCNVTQNDNSISRIFCEKGCNELLICEDISPMKQDPLQSMRDDEESFSLGEGSTPLIPLNKIGKRLGLEKLFAKLEFMSPTGSFKDRGSSLVINIARKERVAEFVEDSSGNAGASLSAYAGATDIKAHIFVPDSAGKGKLDQISIFGAKLHKIEGPRENSTIAAKDYSKKNNIPYLSHNLSPYFSEGMKSFAYEIYSEFGEVDHIIFPTGNGSLLLGTWRGFIDISENSNLSLPKLHAAQSSIIEPIVAEFSQKKWNFDPSSKTIASGISVSNPPRLIEIVDAIKNSDGSATSSSDNEALIWHEILAKEEGIYSEKTCAFSFATLEKLVKSGIIKKNEKIIIPITGSGLKEST